MKVALFNSKTGTTLIEVMIALMIIGIIIIGGGMFFFHGRVNIVREAHRRAAVLVASQRLEELKAANWDDIVGKYAEKIVPEDLPEEYGLPDGEMDTEAHWVGGDDYLEVTVTVRWSDSTANTVSSTTLIAPP